MVGCKLLVFPRLSPCQCTACEMRCRRMSPLWLHLPAYAGTLETGFCTWVGVQLARVEWSLCSRPNEPEKRYALAFTLSNVVLNSCRSQFESQCTDTRSPRSTRLHNLILRSEAIVQIWLEIHRKLRVWRRAHVRNRSTVARPRSQSWRGNIFNSHAVSLPLLPILGSLS